MWHRPRSRYLRHMLESPLRSPSPDNSGQSSTSDPSTQEDPAPADTTTVTTATTTTTSSTTSADPPSSSTTTLTTDEDVNEEPGTEAHETIEVITIPCIRSSTLSLTSLLSTTEAASIIANSQVSSSISALETENDQRDLVPSRRRSHHLTSLRPEPIRPPLRGDSSGSSVPAYSHTITPRTTYTGITTPAPGVSLTTQTVTSVVSTEDSSERRRESYSSQSGTSSTMGDDERVAEKLRQFQSNVKKDENEDTRGTYNSSMMSDLEKQRRRNLIFDEERFEETFLKCLICREVYNEVDKLPKMLHCHHTFCLDCLLQMYRVEGEFRQSLTNVFRSMPMTVKIQCPTCREGIIISEPELRRLPNDHTIMELLFFVNQTGKNEVQYCTKHQMQPLNFFCEPCIMPVCCDCTVIDHKESKGHLVVNVDDAMKKYTPIVEETLGDIRTEKSSLAEKRLALEHAQDDLDQVQRDLNDQIRSVFDSIKQILEDRERELYDAAEGEIEKKRGILDGHMKVLSERESQLNAQFNELQKAKDEKDISQLFSGHKTAREVLARSVFVPTNSTKGFSVTFQFSSRSDNVIKQQVSSLGDIIFQS